MLLLAVSYTGILHFMYIWIIETKFKSTKQRIQIVLICFDDFIFQNDVGPTPFHDNFKEVTGKVDLEEEGDENPYHCPNIVEILPSAGYPMVRIAPGWVLFFCRGSGFLKIYFVICLHKQTNKHKNKQMYK